MKSIKQQEELLQITDKDRSDYYEMEEDYKELLAWAKQIKKVCERHLRAGCWDAHCRICNDMKELLEDLPE